MTKTAILNGHFITMDPQRPLQERASMIIEGERITHFAETLDPQLLENCDCIDGSSRLYLPGLVNTHGHTAMSLLRGYSDDASLQQWFQKIWPLEDQYDQASVRWGSLLSMLEMIKGGTTCFVDMYDRMDQIANAVAESGMRAVLTRGIMGLCPREVWQAKLREATTFVKNWQGVCDGRITTMMAPHAPYTCPPELLESIVASSQELDVPLHTHLCETLAEIQECETRYGLKPIAYLKKCQAFSRPFLAAHLVHVTDSEIEELAAHQVHISHNPGSNLKLGSGIAPLKSFLERGMIVGLGTDSPASNNNLDMFGEIQLAALIHKGALQDPTAISAKKALQMGTCDGARALWLQDLGIIKIGMKADFIGVDIDQAHFYPQRSLLSHLVYSASARDVADMWVNGKQLMKNRELLTLDEEKIQAEFTKCYQKLIG